MTKHRHTSRSELFLVRLRTEGTEDGVSEPVWHGRVQRAGSGESLSFAGWQGLLDAILTMVSEQSSEQIQDDAATMTPDALPQASNSP